MGGRTTTMYTKSMRENPRREAGPTKVVGADSEYEAGLLRSFAEAFAENRKHPYEREQTPEEQRTVAAILERFPDYVAQFGAEAPPFTPEHVHIVDLDQLSPERQREVRTDEHEMGYYLGESQQIVVFSSDDDLRNAQRIVHELFHATSFQSYTRQQTKGKSPIRLRRVGFEIVPGNEGDVSFVDLNEAVTEELARRFDEQCFGEIGELAEARAQRERVRDNIQKAGKSGEELASVMSRRLQNEKWETSLTPYSYREQRYELGKLCGEIAETHHDQFADANEVFSQFARSYFSGKLKDVARLIEDVRGKGPFRELAERTSRPADERNLQNPGT